jgi:hypothetical protein
MSTGRKTSNGIEFGPTQSGKIYLCAKWHRGRQNTTHKTKWIITYKEEFEVFCCADDADWKDDAGNYWSIKNGEAIGDNDERVAKFPVTQNSHDPWHGYPVRHDRDKPPLRLIYFWKENSLINRVLARRLRDGRMR